MKNKKIFIRLCAVVLLVCTISTFVGCRKINNDSSSVNMNSSEEISFADDTSSIDISLEETNPETSSEQSSSNSLVSSQTTTPSNQTESTTSDIPKINDSTNIVFKDENAKVIVKGIGLVPVREAYEKGYIRIKIINGLAYTLHTLNGVDYIQGADPDTGISYDGESPIIYTYTDGTTGTEKRDGAKYEVTPGIYRYIYFPKDNSGRFIGSVCASCNKTVGSDYYPNSCVQFDNSQYCAHCGIFVEAYVCHCCEGKSFKYCSHCGKVAGDGWGGTCLRYWTSGDHECYSCGEIFPANTCHTCSKGCKYCGKTMGDGTNNTCYRDYFNPQKCPSCKTEVQKNTCHTCE